MSYNKALIAHKLQRWDQYITDYHLPQWESIPDFGLYMDQVVLLLERYLSFIPPVNEEKERIVTASAINNYVRTGIMPPPNRKKYERIHIAYLIMICSLKQSLSMSEIQKIIPSGLSEDEIRSAYTDFVRQYTDSVNFFVELVEEVAKDTFQETDAVCDVDAGIQSFVLLTAVIANFSKLLTTKLLALQNCPFSAAAVADKE